MQGKMKRIEEAKQVPPFGREGIFVVRRVGCLPLNPKVKLAIALFFIAMPLTMMQRNIE